MEQALINGESQQQIIRRIKRVAGMSAKQAKRVAQTERNRIQSEARDRGINEAVNRGLAMQKQWIARLVNTRDSHERVHLEVVDAGAKFSNGLEFPGDPNAPPAEIINCFCVIKPIVKSEALAEHRKWARDMSFEQYRKAVEEGRAKGISKAWEALTDGRGSGKIGDTDGDTTIIDKKPFDFGDKKSIMNEIKLFKEECADTDREYALVFSPSNIMYRLRGHETGVNTNLIGEDDLVGNWSIHNHRIADKDSFGKADFKSLFSEKAYQTEVISGNLYNTLRYEGAKEITPEVAEDLYGKALRSVWGEKLRTDRNVEYEQLEIMRNLSKNLEGLVFVENV